MEYGFACIFSFNLKLINCYLTLFFIYKNMSGKHNTYMFMDPTPVK